MIRTSRITALLATFILILSLAACSGKLAAGIRYILKRGAA